MLISYTGGHDMRLLGIENKVERLIIFCILSEEVGKPSDKFVEDFITNFGGIIKNNNWYIPENKKSTLNEMVKNKDAIETEGGAEFYWSIPNNLTAEQLREYINNYRCELPPSIEVVEEQTTDTISDESIIIEDKAIDGGDNDMMDWLKHDCRLDVKGGTNGRGSFDGIVDYDSKTNKFIIKAGSKTAGKIASHVDDKGKQLLIDLVNRKILSREGVYLKDCETNSLSQATFLISLASNGYANVYIHNSEGTELSMVKDAPWLYKILIESGRSKK